MTPYSQYPFKQYNFNGVIISSFIQTTESNLDKKTVNSFGEEWEKFNAFKTADLVHIGKDYFDLLNLQSIENYNVLDVGCGSGRWARYLSPYVNSIEAIDPSKSVFSAAINSKSISNIRFSQASVSNIPFDDNSFDLIYSLGVLHHIPNTEDAIKMCYSKIKKNGLFLLYLYYNFENRGVLYRGLFIISDILRKVISKLPNTFKMLICDIIAFSIYWPLANLSRLTQMISKKASDKMPLSYYTKTSFYVMRNDALDRFGTPLEKRFSKREINSMLVRSGFSCIKFSDQKPYWHVLAQKK